MANPVPPRLLETRANGLHGAENLQVIAKRKSTANSPRRYSGSRTASSGQFDTAALSSPVRLVISSHHPVMLEGLTCVLGSERLFTIVATCSSGIGCISMLRKLRPDVALIDISMPGLNGIEILDIVRAEDLPTRIVFLTASITDRDLTAAATRGAHGILFKNYSPGALLDGLREVASGRKCLPITLINGAGQCETEQKNGFLGFSALTGREREVMLLAAVGLPNKQIARHLNLGEGTVKVHLHNVYSKLGVRTRTSLAAFAESHCGVLPARHMRSRAQASAAIHP